MASRIKGITIEIDGNTTKLDKALQSTDDQLKKTQASLKDVNRLLKMDPGNTELLAQKQRLLADAVSGTGQRLETLKKAAEDADAALARGNAYRAKYGQLDAELAKVSASYKDLQKQKEEMDAALSIGEISTEEYEKYSAKVQETGEQLKELRAQKKEADKEFQGAKIDQSQYDSLQRELLETEQAYQSAQDAAKNFNATAAGLQAGADKVAAGAGKISSAFAPVTAAIAGIGAAAVITTADFDKQMSQVAAISGATGEDLQALRDKAREMGETTKFSASEAAEAMNYMAMAGWKTEDMLSGIEGIMNLAAASGESLATTADIVTDALTAFGLSAQDSSRFSDVLAAASSNANTNVSMMGETFKYVAPLAGALGYSVEDTAVAIGLMANSGIKASQAGTSLRTIISNLGSEFTLTGESLGAYTIKTTNAQGEMKSLSQILDQMRFAFASMTATEQAANAEFLAGKNAMSGLLALMNAAPADIEKLNEAIENSTGASERMASVMQDNLSGQMDILKSQISELLISFGDLFIPTVRSVVSVLQGFFDILNNLPDGVKSTIAWVLMLVASISPIAKIVSSISGAISGITSVASLFSATAGNSVYATFLKWSLIIVAVVAALTALVALISVLTGKSNEVERTLNSLGNYTTSSMGSVSSGRSGSSSYGLNSSLNDLPYLADGGLAKRNNPFLAVVGDNKTQDEVISPYSTIVDAVMEGNARSGGNGGVQSITLNVNGDLAALFRLFRIGIQTEDARLGPSLAKT